MKVREQNARYKHTKGLDCITSSNNSFFVTDSYVENGKLVLANTEHNPPIQGTAPTGTFRYSSGWINSLHKRYYNGSEKGSYLEIRAKFPSGNKVWPAIWMVAEEPVWPPEVSPWTVGEALGGVDFNLFC